MANDRALQHELIRLLTMAPPWTPFDNNEAVFWIRSLQIPLECLPPNALRGMPDLGTRKAQILLLKDTLGEDNVWSPDSMEDQAKVGG